MSTYRAPARRHLATSPFKPPAPAVIKEFTIGERVTHDREGLGTVISVENGIAVIVDFGATKLRICAPFAKLHNL
jgi:hypothetical protein